MMSVDRCMLLGIEALRSHPAVTQYAQIASVPVFAQSLQQDHGHHLDQMVVRSKRKDADEST
jgi:hypothetical protein